MIPVLRPDAVPVHSSSVGCFDAPDSFSYQEIEVEGQCKGQGLDDSTCAAATSALFCLLYLQSFTPLAVNG